MIHLNAVELGWITVNLVAAVLTVAALIDARSDWSALKAFNGSARGIVARGNFRRETFRLGSQLALLLVALPSVFTNREVNLSLSLVALLLVPVFILANTLSDRQMRHALAHKLEADIVKERDASLGLMEARLNARADERAGIVTEQAEGLQAVADETNETAHRIDERLS
jgi:hypothetical protein